VVAARRRPVISAQGVSPEQAGSTVEAGQRPWLLTGGAGYIGSHVARALVEAGERVVVLDDLSTGLAERVAPGVPLVVADVADAAAVRRTMREHDVRGVIHLAAKKSVPDSCAEPLGYYRENLVGLLTLLEAMRAEGVVQLVFSSSAAVYGTPDTDTVDELSPTRPQSPYGRTKLAGEWMVQDACAAYGLRAVSLRYFNVVGCAEPALADVGGTNLFPRILAQLEATAPVTVFSADSPTADGTCVRDYIHVADLARAHVAAAGLTSTGTFAATSATGTTGGGHEVVNVGCGRGHTVLEVLREFSVHAGRAIPYVLGGVRPGDPASMVADAAKAGALLGWAAQHGLDRMVADTWAAAALPAAGALPAGVGR
jgi:UDP-glucose 4-epimerase